MRTSLSNQLRGLLGEYGIALSTAHAALRRGLPELFDREQINELSIFFKELLESQYNMLLMIQQQIDEFDIKIKNVAQTKDVCKRVQQVEGIGPITAVALAATIGNPNDFKNGRHFAAFVGLVPKQHSSGGKDRLLGISKRGDGYLRTLLIHGARAVLLRVDKIGSAKTCYVTRPLKADGVMRRLSANFIRARVNYPLDSLRCRIYERNLYLKLLNVENPSQIG